MDNIIESTKKTINNIIKTIDGNDIIIFIIIAIVIIVFYNIFKCECPKTVVIDNKEKHYVKSYKKENDYDMYGDDKHDESVECEDAKGE